MLTSATTSDKEFGRNPIGPKGCGGTAPLPLSLLLANAHTLTRRRFAKIGAVALATIAMLFRKRATSRSWSATGLPRRRLCLPPLSSESGYR